MNCKPKYANNIIVGINYRDNFSWYVTEKDYWILDIIKRKDDFLKNGYNYDINLVLDSRFYIEIVNEDTIEAYLNALSEYKVDFFELKKMIVEGDYEDTILSLNPSLFIDFDNRRLLSCFPETLPFERYVPSGWIGEYKVFDEYVPEIYRYWIVDGINLINDLYQKELKEFMEDQDE